MRSRPGGQVDPPPGGGEGVLAGPDWRGWVEGVDVDGAGDGAGGPHGPQGRQPVQPAEGAWVGVGLALGALTRVQTVAEAGQAVVTVIYQVQQVTAALGHLKTALMKVSVGGVELSAVLKYQHFNTLGLASHGKLKALAVNFQQLKHD